MDNIEASEVQDIQYINKTARLFEVSFSLAYCGQTFKILKIFTNNWSLSEILFKGMKFAYFFKKWFMFKKNNLVILLKPLVQFSVHES